jgi:hypothetical protein
VFELTFPQMVPGMAGVSPDRHRKFRIKFLKGATCLEQLSYVHVTARLN